MCVQETWFAKQDLHLLNKIHSEFRGVGSSAFDYENGLLGGRPFGGVAILWRNSFDHFVKHLDFGLDWCVGVEICINSRTCVLLCVYLPYQCDQNLEDYSLKLGALGAILEELNSTCYTIIGDWNVDLCNNTSVFAQLAIDFCQDRDLVHSSQVFLPMDTYSFVSSAWGSTSWIDHAVSSMDFHNTINRMSMSYDITDEDHIPFLLFLNLDIVPELTVSDNCLDKMYLCWDKISESQLKSYTESTHQELTKISTPQDVINCKNLNCKDPAHLAAIDKFYNDIVSTLTRCANKINNKPRNFKVRPGWNDLVSDLYEDSRDARRLWLASGKPRSGPIFETFSRLKARFKYSLRNLKRHEDTLRRESLARKLGDLQNQDFWKEIKVLNNSRTPLPSNIEGNTGSDNILNMWKSHFQKLFNCVDEAGRASAHVSIEPNPDEVSEITVNPKTIERIIKELKVKKSCGMDGIFVEHLQYSSTVLVDFLSQCISSFFVHCYLPDSLMSVVLVPIIKSKSGSINSKNNYRPIALASVLSKVVEKVLISRFDDHVYTSTNQFGFKRKHGTDQCIFALKEVIDCYRQLNGAVFVCFLDASKAFDRINHVKLFDKLSSRGVPTYIVRLLAYWYANQSFCVRWGNEISSTFCVTNGVRQGGILSPYLFNLYFDDLSSGLNEIHCGCVINDVIVNHLMYADDLVLLAPSVSGLQKLVNCCESYANLHDVIFNASKSACMLFRPKGNKNNICTTISLNDSVIPVVTHTKYLGHIICDTLSDHLDIQRQEKQLYVQGNILLRRFYMCSTDVKLTLFRSYCTPMYTTHLWWNYSKVVIRKLYTAYHNILKLLIGFSKYESNSLLCTLFDVKSCAAVIRHHVYKFMVRLSHSPNVLIRNFEKTSLIYTSRIRLHWRNLLFVQAV